jgi:hypothetical protein
VEAMQARLLSTIEQAKEVSSIKELMRHANAFILEHTLCNRIFSPRLLTTQSLRRCARNKEYDFLAPSYPPITRLLFFAAHD